MTNLLTLCVAGVIIKKYGVFHDIKIALGLSPEEKTAQYWAVRGWNNTIEKLDCQRDIVFFGNSITFGSDFRSSFPNAQIAVCGFPGDNLTGMLQRIPSIRYFHPKAVFAMGGINGLQSQTIEEFTEQYNMYAQMLLDSIPFADIYLESILPVNTTMCNLKLTPDRIQQANTVIKEFADKHQRCIFVDLYSLYEENGIMPAELTRDGIHLKPKSYKRWAEAIRHYIDYYENDTIKN
jgi:lysophospholipase L1-like esterase